MGPVQGAGERSAASRAKRKAVRRAIPLAAMSQEAAEVAAPWKMPSFDVPTFPDRIVNIRDFGALADDRFDCSAAITDAIESCAKAGGGRVVIPAGNWFTGPIHLRSNIDLHFEQGAT